MRTELSGTRYSKSSLLVCLFLALVSVSSYAADTSKGAGFYSTHCASCHGASGVNVMPNAPNFAQGESMMQPDASLLASIKAGKNAMPGYLGILSDRDIMDVIAFLRTLH